MGGGKQDVGKGRRRDIGKDFWLVITLNLDSEDEQELDCEERQFLGKKNNSWMFVIISVICNCSNHRYLKSSHLL